MNHPLKAKAFVANNERMHWHDKALWFVREKRDLASKGIPEWEQLREYASNIKSHTMSQLDYYLEEFEKNANKKGIKVHWAKDAIEHNAIVYSILKENKVKNEYYVSEIYNMLLKLNTKFEIDIAEEFTPLGTPNDLKKFEA